MIRIIKESMEGNWWVEQNTNYDRDSLSSEFGFVDFMEINSEKDFNSLEREQVNDKEYKYYGIYTLPNGKTEIRNNEWNWDYNHNGIYTFFENEDFEMYNEEYDESTYSEDEEWKYCRRWECFTNLIGLKPKKKRTMKKVTDINKMTDITPYIIRETEKAYGIEGKTRYDSNKHSYIETYEWIAKSICIEQNGKIYAPNWAWEKTYKYRDINNLGF